MKLRYLALVLAVLAAGYAAGRAGLPGDLVHWGDAQDRRAARSSAPPDTADPPIGEGLTAEERRDIEVFRRSRPPVVFIASIALRRDSFSFDVQQIPQVVGSGVVWDKQGHVVTNFHVELPGWLIEPSLQTVVGGSPMRCGRMCCWNCRTAIS